MKRKAIVKGANNNATMTAQSKNHLGKARSKSSQIVNNNKVPKVIPIIKTRGMKQKEKANVANTTNAVVSS